MSAVAVPAGAARARRARTGFGLLILAVAGSLLAYVLQGLGLHGEVPRNLAVYGLVFTGASLGGWLVIRYAARSADPALYPVAVLLGGLGLAMLYRLMDERGRVDIARDQAIRLLQEQIAANPQHRVGLAKMSHWWWRSLRNDRRFQDLVGTSRP